MLSSADIFAGRLLVQAGDASLEEVRTALKQVDADEGALLDVLARLHQRGAIDQALVSRTRRHVALYERNRNEAAYLKALDERRLFPKAEIHRLIAQIEADTYRRRLRAILVDRGMLLEQDALDLQREVRLALREDDKLAILASRAQDFADVVRPLLGSGRIDTVDFAVSRAFRSDETGAFVAAELARIAKEGPDDRPRVKAQGAPVSEPQKEGRAAFGRGGGDTTRLRLLLRPRRASSIAAPKKIGPYAIEEALRQDGEAVTYLARELTGGLVCLKTLTASDPAHDELARFDRERAITSRLDHPATPKLLDEGQTSNGLPYMVFPFYSGKTLREILAESGPPPLPQCFAILDELLEALSAVHLAGFVHRGVRPKNIFLTEGEARVKLLDFSLARALDDHEPPNERMFRTSLGVISGSPSFLAPETVADDRIDHRTDLYSLGVTFFLLVTGALPLGGETPYEKISEHLVGVPRTLGQARPRSNWHSDLESLLASMLGKSLDDRPMSCSAIQERLRGGVRERALLAHAEPSPERPEASSLFNRFFRMLGGGSGPKASGGP